MRNITQIMIFFIVTFFSFNAFSQVGINTLLPMSMLDVNGNMSLKVITLFGSSSSTEINDGVYISVNPQAADQDFNIPSAVTYPGRIYIIRNINGSNTAAISSLGGMFFYKGTTSEANSSTHKIYLYENNRTVIVISDGQNWTVFN